MVTIGKDILRYGGTGLYAIPSVHFDVVFADLVHAASLQRAFDVVAVELPCNLDPAALADAVDALWPTAGVAVCDGARRAHGMLEAGSDQDGSLASQTPVFRTHVVPLVPCDSIVAAIRASRQMRREDGQPVLLDFVDLPAHCGDGDPPRVPVTLSDTWRVARHGLDAYLEAVGDRVAIGRLPEDDAREREMARRLRVHIDAGRRILFVCGMAHWRRITAWLDAGQPAASGLAPVPRGGRSLAFQAFAVPAAHAWYLGWMGIPAVMADFMRRQTDGVDQAGRFDFPAALARFTSSAVAEAQATEGLCVSPRQAQVFDEYLISRLALAGRWVPHLDGDLHHAAQSCVGDRWADALKAAALRYPYDEPPASMPQAHLIQHQGIPYLLAGRRAYAVDRRASGSGDDQERRSLPSVPAPLSRTERMAAGLLPYIRSVPPEDTLQRAMVRHAWMLGDLLGHHRRSKAGATRSARFTGDLGQGIDWRRTLRAWADGEPEREFYVKAAARRGRLGRPPSRAARPQAAGRPCPVAWIFAPSATVEQRACARMFDTYSSFYWLRAVVRGAGNITRETVGYCVNVLRGRSDWDEASVRRMLDALPLAEHPRIAPWDDPELAGFRGPDLAVAAAVRWAHDRAIVVADHGCDLGLACQAYARRRGVDLVKISWDAFGDDARRRLAVQHTAPSKSHFADPPPYVLRVIPPVPAFNPPRGFGERTD